MRESYAFRFQFRIEEGAPLQGRSLFKQFGDCYAAIEQDQLNTTIYQQNMLCTESWRGLGDD